VYSPYRSVQTNKEYPLSWGLYSVVSPVFLLRIAGRLCARWGVANRQYGRRNLWGERISRHLFRQIVVRTREAHGLEVTKVGRPCFRGQIGTPAGRGA
jgi:hypothetical protein